MTDRTEDIRVCDPLTGQWRTVRVTVPDTPVRHMIQGIPAHYSNDPRSKCPRCVPPARARRDGAPVNRDGLSTGSPLPAWWRDTAYAPGEPLADARTYVKPPAMRTHRPAIVAPARELGDMTVTGRPARTA